MQANVWGGNSSCNWQQSCCTWDVSDSNLSGLLPNFYFSILFVDKCFAYWFICFVSEPGLGSKWQNDNVCIFQDTSNAEECACQMLWWWCKPQEEASWEAKRRQEADETCRVCWHSTGGVPFATQEFQSVNQIVSYTIFDMLQQVWKFAKTCLGFN